VNLASFRLKPEGTPFRYRRQAERGIGSKWLGSRVSRGRSDERLRDAADRKRNAKHPAKVLTLVVAHRHRTSPTRRDTFRFRSAAPRSRLPESPSARDGDESTPAEPPTGG